MLKKLIVIILLLTTSSCVEIIDDLTINSNGSGKLNYSINLSQSKTEINSYLSLDYFDGKKVPSRDELRNKIYLFRDKLESKEGVSNCKVTIDESNYIIKFSCDFNSISQLQNGIKEVISEMSGIEKSNDVWITHNGDTTSRIIPTFVKDFKVNDEHKLKLLDGVYISITRFSKVVKSYSNENTILSANKRFTMNRVNTLDLVNDPSILDNQIVLY
jgi:hypothetical protein